MTQNIVKKTKNNRKQNLNIRESDNVDFLHIFNWKHHKDFILNVEILF